MKSEILLSFLVSRMQNLLQEEPDARVYVTYPDTAHEDYRESSGDIECILDAEGNVEVRCLFDP